MYTLLSSVNLIPFCCNHRPAVSNCRTKFNRIPVLQANNSYMPLQDTSLWAVLSLRAKIEASSDNALKRKGFRRTFLQVCLRHASTIDLQSLDFLFATILGMVFHPRHSLHVCPRHVQVTVSRSRGIHWPLRCVPESSSPAAWRSRLHHGRGAAARPRAVRITTLSTGVSSPDYHMDPTQRQAR